MKTFGGFIGLIFGFVVGIFFCNSLYHWLICCLVGFFICRYIGGISDNIEEKEKEHIRKHKRQKAISLCNKYPEAAKYYFKLHWGMKENKITQNHITYNRVNLLLSHSEDDYRKQEKIEKEKIEVRKREEKEAKRREQENHEKWIKARDLCLSYPEAAKYYFKYHGIEKPHTFTKLGYLYPNQVDMLLTHTESDYIQQEKIEKAKIEAKKKEQEEELARQKEERKNKAISLCKQYPEAANYFFRNFLGIKKIDDITEKEVEFLLAVPEAKYIKTEESERAKIEARKKEEERKRKEEELARQKEERRNRAASICEKYPLSAKYFLRKSFRIRNISKITDKEVDILLSKPESEYIKQEELEKVKIEARRREQEEARRKEEERKRIEEELARQREEEAKRQLESSLRACVSSWDDMLYGLKTSYLLYYYPTTCEFEATNEEWDNRWLVWNFKNTPGKTSTSDHKNALNKIIPMLKQKLMSTFGEDRLKHLTLVCIPASSQDKTQARYEEFSNRLCSELGMTNAYPHIRVVSEKESKYAGGPSLDISKFSFDEGFFRDKYVLLFDDVITKGESMLKFNIKMRSLGAKVVGGMSIGITKHERP